MAMKSGGTDDLNSEINVTPMVDVMLVLLIIFMITAPLLNTTGVDVELPQTVAAKIDDPEGKLVLSINTQKQVFLGGTQATWKDLEAKHKANERVKRESELYIEADGKLPYAVIISAMAIAKSAGVAKVLMLTDPGDNLTLEELDKTAGRPPASVSP